MDDFSDIRGRLSFPKNHCRPGIPAFFYAYAIIERPQRGSYLTSDNACYVAFYTPPARSMAAILNLGSHGPFDPESYHALPRQFFSPHGG
jgi:hypothetical protein